MTIVVGGLRTRLIRDSIYHMIYDALEELGWFDAGRRHLPISFTGDITAQDDEIAFNTVTISVEDTYESDLELGSNAVETTTTFYVDFFAENDAIGTHLINDVRDIVAGRMSTIGRTHARVPIFDFRMATPAVIFNVEIERVQVDRALGFPKPWQKHWYACNFEVIDAYRDISEPSEYNP